MAITTLNLRGLNRSDTATTGQVVTATSAVAMDFQAAGGGEWTRLNTQTISSSIANFTVDNVFSSTYQTYKLFWNDVDYSAAAYPLIQFLTGGDGTVASGSTYKVKYNFTYNGLTAHASAGGSNTQTTGFSPTSLYNHNHSDYGSTGEITFFNPADNTQYNAILFNTNYYDGTHWRNSYGNGYYDGAKISATGYKLSSNTGTIDTGEYTLYGIKRA